ncbi:MAG: trypsin-like peptidase domain-containing protein [Planctomycetes bacterium]|nr:trypsin-like peptidase domain-containing protein [Planctomycetota bacterium]
MQVESLAEQLFFTTVRIDTIAQSGAPGSGTGFFFAYKAGEVNYPFVVTNKHVVMGMLKGALSLLQSQGQHPKLGHGFRLAIDSWQDAWFGHPSPDIDIAICPFAQLEAHVKRQYGIDLFYRYVPNGIIPSEEELANLDAIESVTFIGYPNGIWDSKNLLPVARRGTTASLIHVDFENTPRFLIDASVFGGSSGSPVFVMNQGMFTQKSGGTNFGCSRLLFVGVIAGVFFRTQLNQIVAVPIPTQVQPMVQQQEMIDLGIVFKARTVVETVEAFLKARNVT